MKSRFDLRRVAPGVKPLGAELAEVMSYPTGFSLTSWDTPASLLHPHPDVFKGSRRWLFDRMVFEARHQRLMSKIRAHGR